MWIFIPVFFSFSECYVKTILPEGIVNYIQQAFAFT